MNIMGSCLDAVPKAAVFPFSSAVSGARCGTMSEDFDKFFKRLKKMAQDEERNAVRKKIRRFCIEMSYLLQKGHTRAYRSATRPRRMRRGPARAELAAQNPP